MSSAADEFLIYAFPLFKYLVDETEFGQMRLYAYCKAIEIGWKNNNFSYNATIDEVIEYHNAYVNGAPQNLKFENSEFYLFNRYVMLICSLDSYGRCNTLNGMNAALERGRQHLNAGLISSLKRMKPWAFFAEAYGDSMAPMNLILSIIRHAAAFTNTKGVVEEEAEQEVTRKWRAILRDAIDKFT